MSWQKRSIQLILGLPLALPIVSYAIEVGDTYVESGQNQPLNASINVIDIDPATFSVKVGNAAMYQQLGLSPDHPIDVKFQPTSSNGGKIVLTSKQPVATPYTDVVLDIQNKGEKKVLPKTLLMPLGGNPMPTSVNQTPAPLVVPPEPTKVTVDSHSTIELPKTTAIETTSEPAVDTKDTEAKTVTQASTEPSLATTRGADKQVTDLPTKPLENANITYRSDSLVIQETKGAGTVTSSNTATSATESAQSNVTQTEETPSKTAVVKDSAETVTYVIQRNDNLWSIANRVAKQNKKDVHAVMQEIINQNPDAFDNGDPTKIVANTKLNLPKYETTPSQAGIKTAKQLRKQVGKARKPVYTKATTKPTEAPNVTKPAVAPKATHTKKVVKTRKSYPVVKSTYTPRVSRPKPRKTQMVIVAPQQTSGSAQGTVKNTAKGVNSQVVAQLEQKRQATAAQATKVNELNNTISSSEQKIKLQNQKLAQLEQRLKELNKK